MHERNPVSEGNIWFLSQLFNSEMKCFGCLFQIGKNGRVGFGITLLEQMFVEGVCNLGTIKIIHGPYVR
jgi:hypothetical protein